MKMRYETTLKVVFLCLLAMPGWGLTETATAQFRGQGGVALTVGFPRGEFDRQVHNEGFGVNLYGLAGVGRSPLHFGVDFSLLIYGHERRHEPFSLTIPDVTVDVVTDNNIFMGHLLLRLQPPVGPVRPYVDGLFGFKHFFTETRIKDDNLFDGPTLASSTNFNDTALSYGVGGGVQFRVHRGRGRRGGVFLNLGMRYFFGGEASYLKKGAIVRDHGRVAFDVTRTETELLQTQLGVTVQF